MVVREFAPKSLSTDAHLKPRKVTLLGLSCVFLWILQSHAFAQFGGPAPGTDPTLSLESINERIRARKAQEARIQEESARLAEQERRRQEKTEREYVSKREAARVAIRELPDTPERQLRLDQFSCMYPSSATSPPTPLSVENCMQDLERRREQAKQDAAAEQGRKAEQDARDEQKRANEAALRAAQERKANEERVAKAAALLAAEEAAREASVADSRSRLAFGVTTVLGLAALIVIGRYRRKQGGASIATALTMSFFSGLLLYFMAVMLFGVTTGVLSRSFAVVTLFGGWAVSMHLLLSGAVSASKVLARGFLLGAAEWFAMIPVGFFVAGKAVSETVAKTGGSDASQVGAAIGGGIIASLSGGISIAMALTCLIGYAITYFMTREMKPETAASTKKCPECAEIIQAEARKCRYCGAVLLSLDPNALETNVASRPVLNPQVSE